MCAYKFDSEIMRAYDIRGVFQKNLHPTDAYHLGKAIAKMMYDENLPLTICIGRDGRMSSPELHKSLVEGLISSGCNIIDIGLVATPTLYYATVTRKTSAGIMVTGSYNPKDQNGFKIMYHGKPFYGKQIEDITALAQKGNYLNKEGAITALNIEDEYISYLITHAAKTLKKPLKIAWDPGNGATGHLVELLTQGLACKNFAINTAVDGNFPNHHPDPTIPANLEQLKEVVLKEGCDIGFAFDGDGDRLGAIDSKGRMIFGDQLLLILARDLLSRVPNAKVIADVKTSDLILQKIKEEGGNPIIWKTGHSLIKAKMREENALLAGEMSGHLFFGEDYFSFDDALFGACKLINILSASTKSLTELIDELPKTYSTPEIRIEVEEIKKFQIVENVKNLLNQKNIRFNDLDGIRVQETRGWWLVRASNTQNALIVRVEGNSKDDLASLTEELLKYFKQVGLTVSL